MPSKSLKGKTALVTGSAKRLGRSIALALAAEGVNVVAHYNRSESEALELCRETCALGARCLTIAGDFQKREEYETLIERTVSLAGSLDILINNASGFSPGALKS